MVVVAGGGVADATSVVVFEPVVFFCFRLAVAFFVALCLAELRVVAAATLDGDAPPDPLPDPELVTGWWVEASGALAVCGAGVLR